MVAARRRVALLLTAAMALALSACDDDPAPPSGGHVDTCHLPPTVLVASAEVARPLIRAATDCANLTVRVESPASVMTGPRLPEAWIADTAWLERAGRPPTRPFASSPVVVVTRSPTAPTSWRQVLTTTGLQLGDPRLDSASQAPLLLGGGSLRGRLRDAERADRRLGHAQHHAVDRVEDVAVGISDVTVATEQVALQSGRDVSATLPADRTWLLRYALATTDRPHPALGAWLVSDRVQRALRVSRLRDAAGTPLPRGVGPVRRQAEPDPGEITELVTRWDALR